MKWYKHISDSLDDPFIFDLMTKYGSDGYVVFFGTIEIYSREFKPENGWKLVVSWSYFHQKLRISQSKVKKILSEISKWSVVDHGSTVSVFIPKFTELLDEWTQRKIGKTRELLGSESGQTPEILMDNKELDTDKDKDIPPTPRKREAAYSNEFMSFYSAYPKKVGRDAAWRAWKKRNGDLPHIEEILRAIREQCKSDKWTKDGGQFIPNPATWINAGSWADEVTAGEIKGGQKEHWE